MPHLLFKKILMRNWEFILFGLKLTKNARYCLTRTQEME